MVRIIELPDKPDRIGTRTDSILHFLGPSLQCNPCNAMQTCNESLRRETEKQRNKVDFCGLKVDFWWIKDGLKVDAWWSESGF